MTATYGTPIDLARYMGVAQRIPNPSLVNTSRIKETIGTGDNYETVFFFDNGYVIKGGYTLYYGESESTAVALTETTHYTITDYDLGRIELTAAGVTLVDTNNIYADYHYNIAGISNQQAQDALDRAQAEIDKYTDNHFADGSVATPDYEYIQDEKHDGKGFYDRAYYTEDYPIIDVKTTLTADVAVDDTTINVTSTNGFPESGYFAIGTEKFTYSAKTSTTFIVSAATQTHTTGDTVTSCVIEVSADDSGTNPTWTVLQPNTEYDIDFNSGRVHIYEDDVMTTSIINTSAPRLIPNRVRLSYLSGWNTIPSDINRLCLMIAAKDLIHTVVRKSYSEGRNTFNPDLINIDEQWIQNTLNEYKMLRSSNV